MKKIVSTNKAPQAIGPYSQAVECKGMLFISGQIAIDTDSGVLIDGNVKEQTELVMKNIEIILGSAGYSFDDVVKSTCLLVDMKDFETMNEVYSTYYSESQPARATFSVVGLPKGALVEIETLAMK